MKTGSLFAGLFGPLASSKASREYQEALQRAMPEQEYVEEDYDASWLDQLAGCSGNQLSSRFVQLRRALAQSTRLLLESTAYTHPLSEGE